MDNLTFTLYRTNIDRDVRSLFPPKKTWSSVLLVLQTKRVPTPSKVLYPESRYFDPFRGPVCPDDYSDQILKFHGLICL